ncbi:MAG: glycosyltransferase family 4 protein [Candidatus Paceibacterota bacterium]
MNTKRTLLMTTPYFPPDGGGLENYALEIACRLSRDYDWRIVIVTSGEKRGKNQEEEKMGMKIYRLSYDLRFSNTPFALMWPLELSRILKKEKPDIINIHTPVPGVGDIVSFLARKTPQVVTYHTGSMRKGNFLLDLFIGAYESTALRFMLERSNFLICSSDFVHFGFLKKYISKSITITPGVDADNFIPFPTKKAEDPTVLFVAGIGISQRYKGLGTLLKAMKILQKDFPHIRLLVVGDGDMRNDYEKYVQENDLLENVIFKGKLTGELLRSVYQEAHLFSLPTSNDSYPLVILEAMSSGLPVVSTRVGGIPQMVEEGKEGFLIEPNNPTELARKISELINNPKLALNFSVRARRKALNEFSWSVRLEKYNQVLEKAFFEKTDAKRHF